MIDTQYPDACRNSRHITHKRGFAGNWLTNLLRYPFGPVRFCGRMKHVKRDSHGDPVQGPNNPYIYSDI